MPAGVFLLGDEEQTKGIKSRVSRLIALATTERTGSRHAVLTKLFVWGPASMILSACIAANNSYLLARVHYLIEHAVFVLR